MKLIILVSRKPVEQHSFLDTVLFYCLKLSSAPDERWRCLKSERGVFSEDHTGLDDASQMIKRTPLSQILSYGVGQTGHIPQRQPGNSLPPIAWSTVPDINNSLSKCLLSTASDDSSSELATTQLSRVPQPHSTANMPVMGATHSRMLLSETLEKVWRRLWNLLRIALLK